MIEFIFFDPALRDRFVAYAQTLDIPCTLEDDAMGYTVAVPEEIGDEQEEALEQCYAGLEREQSQQLRQEEGGFERIAGIYYTLPDGGQRMVPLPAEFAERLLAAFSMEEVQQLFEAVAASLQQVEGRPLCSFLRDKT